MRLKQLLENFKGKSILVLGDLMVDHYIYGKANRISREAPVPVVEFVSEILKLGGAANTVNNINALGGKVFAVGIVGNDENGTWLVEELMQKGLIVDGIIVTQDRPTTTKTRIIADHHQIVRLDREKRNNLKEKINEQILDYIKTNIEQVENVVISDYDKGVISTRLLRELMGFLKRYDRPVIVDPKISHFFDYKGCSIIKPNVHEASVVTGVIINNEKDLKAMGQKILYQLQCEAVLITRGKDGMWLFKLENDEVMPIPAVAREVYDVTGAGDTSIAALALAIAAGAPIEDAAILANAAAGIKVGKAGTEVVDINEMKRWIEMLERK